MDADSPMTDSHSHSHSSPPSSSTLLSPPASQPATTPSDPQSHTPRSSMPVAASASANANANGKRPLNTISNGLDSEHVGVERVTRSSAAAAATTAAAANDGTGTGTGTAASNGGQNVHEHAGSGYRWERPEDEPGHAWKNKKAVDEYNRAAEGLLHKDVMVRGRYGDPIEMAEKEAAIATSLKER